MCMLFLCDLVQIQALSEEMESLRNQRVVLRKELQEAAATVRLHHMNNVIRAPHSMSLTVFTLSRSLKCFRICCTLLKRNSSISRRRTQIWWRRVLRKSLRFSSRWVLLDNNLTRDRWMIKRLISHSVSSQLSQMSEEISALRDADIQNLTSLTKEKDELQNTLKRTREDGEKLRLGLQKSEETVCLLISIIDLILVILAHTAHTQENCSLHKCCQLIHFVAGFSNVSDYPSNFYFKKHLATCF